MSAPVSFATDWCRRHGEDTPWQRLEAAWDHLAVMCANDGCAVDMAALIESGAAGRRVTLQEPPKGRYEVALVVAS